jgi:hypothetical protein
VAEISVGLRNRHPLERVFALRAIKRLDKGEFAGFSKKLRLALREAK